VNIALEIISVGVVRNERAESWAHL
jgi:hypothetical protein